MLVKDNVVLNIDLFKDNPRELCRKLLSEKLDISPVPSIEYARHAEKLLLLPDLTISSDGKVMSILLVSKIPVQKLDKKTIALTNTSATSQVLAKIILQEKYGISPSYFECPPDLPQMFREADAALLIGDDALRIFIEPGPFSLYDLGQEWKEFTDEKMVYAVWCVRKEYAEKEPEKVHFVYHAFRKSMEMSLKNLGSIASDTARWDSFSKQFLENYFSTLKFEFNKEYQQGLIAYLKKAMDLKAIDSIPKLQFI